MHTCNICPLWQALLVCKHDNYPFWLKLVHFISIFCFSVLLLTAVIPCQALNLLSMLNQRQKQSHCQIAALAA